MKATYQGFEVKRRGGGVQLPPVGAYEAEIQGVRLEKSYSGDRDVLVMMLEITDGEYKGQYHKVFEDQKERFGGDVKYRGTFRLYPPLIENDDPWIKEKWETNLWCVSDSNGTKSDGSYIYVWDWDEQKLKGKKVGINVRERYYTGRDGKEHVTTEIGQLESINDIRKGKYKVLKPRGKKSEETPTAPAEGFTGIELGEADQVEVPF